MNKILITILVLSILIMSGCTLVGQAGRAPAKDIKKISNQGIIELNQKLAQEGGLWTATENKFTGQSTEELKQMLGLNIDNWDEIEANRDDSENYKGTRYNLPDEFDWRDQHGQDYVSPIRDQQSCGSCWAFATQAVLEANANIFYNNPDLDYNLSEQDLVSCFAGDGCSGIYTSEFPDLLDYIVDVKTCTETCFPYVAENSVCSDKCANWQDDAVGITSWETVPLTTDEIKNALVTKGPLITAMLVYGDLHAYDGGVYYPTSNIFLGGHAIAIIGYGQYSDGLEYWIIRNSWGDDWGENGTFRILMGYSGIDSMMVHAIDSPNPAIPEQVLCNDDDFDGYCYWGTGSKPASCPACDDFVEDCDDSDNSIFQNCGMLAFSYGTLEITSVPDGAEVYIKDVASGNYFYRGNTPLTLSLDPGTRDVRIVEESYYDYETSVEIVQDETVYLDATLLERAEIFSPEDEQLVKSGPGQTLEIVGTVPNHSNFQHYTIEYGIGEEPVQWYADGITLTGGGTNPVYEGTLGYWDLSSVTDASYYTIRLTFYGDEQYQDFVRVFFDSTLKTGYPIDAGSVPFNGDLLVADFDHDGDEEIMFPTLNWRINMLNIDGSSVSGWPVQLPSLDYISYADKILLSAEDIDGDNDLEIFILRRNILFSSPIVINAEIYAYHHDGTPVSGWPKTVLLQNTNGGNAYTQYPLVVSDLDNDGEHELIVPVRESKDLFILDESGNVIRQITSDYIYSPVSLGNLDDDDDLEFVFLTLDGSNPTSFTTRMLRAYNLDGTPVDGWPVDLTYLDETDPRDSYRMAPAIGDIDNDGSDEVAITAASYLLVFNKDGTIQEGNWPINEFPSSGGPISLADIDGDSFLELVYNVANQGETKAYNYDGTVVDGWPKQYNYLEEPGKLINFPIIGDVNSDGEVETIVIGSNYIKDLDNVFSMHIIKGNTDPLYGWPKPTGMSHKTWGGTYQYSPVITDLEKDGKIDLLWLTQSSSLVAWEFDEGDSAYYNGWPMGYHDIQRTGYYRGFCADEDGDNYFGFDSAECPQGTDCDDSDANINPGVLDYCGDGIDMNCDELDCADCYVMVPPEGCDCTGDICAFGEYCCEGVCQPDGCNPECVQQPAEGYGITQGAEDCPGYENYAVTSLADSGPGTLRDALSEGCRYITFAVEGTIELQSMLLVNYDYMTIDATNAPGSGITITANPGFTNSDLMQILNGKQVVLKNLRFRNKPTASIGADLFVRPSAANVLIDHCSFTGSAYYNFYLDGAKNVTVQYSIIGNNQKNVYLRNGINLSFHHNLLVSGQSYNPQVYSTSYFDLVNNVMYDWNSIDTYPGTYIRSAAQGNLIKNYYLPGAQSNLQNTVYISGSSVYMSGNEIPPECTTTGTTEIPFSTPAVTTYPAEENFNIVLNEAGACPRDSTDQALIESVPGYEPYSCEQLGGEEVFCGEIFGDCGFVGEPVCCGDETGEYVIGTRCCDAPNDIIKNGRCEKKQKPVLKSEIAQP
ncbi:MAG: C1 family peptidase [archaeon]